MAERGKGKFRLDGGNRRTARLWAARAGFAAVLTALIFPSIGLAAGHGLAMHGAPALPKDYAHLPYANPNAPIGGVLTLGEVGGFDSLNPFILKGATPWELRQQSFESLLVRNWDEPFSLYGLLAERVETPADRAWVAFHLHPEARFSDGAPVTVDDVIASMEVLSAEGRPPYRGLMDGIAQVERLGERGVRFHFKEPDREAPLIMGLRPIMKKADLEARAFAETSLTPLIGSGPYVVGDFEPGRVFTLKRNPDYWARDLPARRGTANFDDIRIEYFRDAATLWEAFKAGEIDLFRDGDAARWANGYDFAEGATRPLTRAEIPHGRPTGLRGFVFNTRNPLFADLRVREALTLAFDFEWVQSTMLAGAFARIPSAFGQSELMHRGAAEGAERALLAPFADVLPEGALDSETRPPVSRGDGRNRRGLRQAGALLEEAGWRVEDGVLVNAKGEAFAFEILLRSSTNEKIAGVFRDALKRLGIAVSVRLVDGAQYQARLLDYDFDMIAHRWALSLSPGAEQRKYWGSAEGRAPGSRNHAGVASAAVDAAIEALVQSADRAELTAAARALDRVLAAGHYVIPFWYAPRSWIAHDAALRRPEATPLYGDWIGWLPNVWWRDPS